MEEQGLESTFELMLMFVENVEDSWHFFYHYFTSILEVKGEEKSDQ